MLIPPDNFEKVYGFIKEDAAGVGSSVMIFCAPDVDSLCCCKIFTDLLRTDFLMYQMKPVSSYENLKEQCNHAIATNSELRSMILLNCGGSVDLLSFLPDLSENINIYVIDSHRPYHPSNVRNMQQIFLLGKEVPDIDENLVAAATAGLGHDDDDSNTEEESDNDSENESDLDEKAEEGDEVEVHKRKRVRAPKRKSEKRRKGFDDLDDIDDIDDLDDQIPFMKPTKKSKRDFYSSPISLIIYSLVVQLDKKTKDALWCAIVGLSDFYLNNRVDDKNYYNDFILLKSNVTEFEEDGDQDANDNEERDLLSDKVLIKWLIDFKFMAYRHWTLYDGMYHSSFVATRLGIWRSHGKRMLDMFLARMGFPLDECKERYSCMNADLKKKLHQRIMEVCEEFGLKQIAFHTFQKQQGFTKTLTASDAALSLMGLLENPTKFNVSSNEQPEETAKLISDEWEKNFCKAYDSISWADNWDYAMEGLQNAVNLQKAIVRQGASLFEGKYIVHTGPFRYCILNQQSSDLQYFCHAISLSRLGIFIMDTLSQTRRAVKPLVICALNEVSNSYLIVGISHIPGLSEFGNQFRMAAQKTGARIKAHTFDGTVVELQREDITKFIEYLHTGMIDTDDDF